MNRRELVVGGAAVAAASVLPAQVIAEPAGNLLLDAVTVRVPLSTSDLPAISGWTADWKGAKWSWAIIYNDADGSIIDNISNKEHDHEQA